MASPTRRVALITLTVLVAGLMAAGIRLLPAQAINPNANLQVVQELSFANNAAGVSTITLTAKLDGAPSLSAGTTVAFELEGGPADTDGATVDTPDRRCVAGSDGSCTVTITSTVNGSGLVRAWVDPDGRQPPLGVTEADTLEGRLSDSTPFVSEGTTNRSDCRDDPSTSTNEDTPNSACFRDNQGQPVAPIMGRFPEPDNTDVVQYTFSGAAARLDCDDSTLGNGHDLELNALEEDEVYTCRATDIGGFVVPGTMIDAENLSSTDGGANGLGANDPDNLPGGPAPDYDTTNAAAPVGGTTFCYTNANGICEATIDAAEGNSGPAYICFWIDLTTTATPTGDANVSPNTPAAPGDGGDCGTNETSLEAEANDGTDTVLIQWSSAAPNATYLDVAEPESPAQAIGSSIGFGVSVFDQFGDPYFGGVTVLGEYFSGSTNDLDGNTPASPAKACSTAGGSSCTISITSSSTGGDLLCIWIADTPNMSGDVSSGTCAGETITDDPTLDSVDVVRATWTAQTTAPPPPQQVSKDQGYVLVGSDGGIFTFGSAQFKGSLGSTPLNQPIIGIAYKPGGTGYWLVAKDGGVFTFGDAQFYGSTGNLKLNSPVLGMEATPDGGGYWLFAADGGIFTFGNAKFHGSTGNMKLNSPVVGMAVTSNGGGYWLVAQDGGIFTFNAPFHGSTGNMKLNQPVFDMAPAKGDKGYWLVARDGGVFTFGSGTPFYGSGVGNVTGNVIGMDATPSGEGYWIADSNGKVVPLGDARSFGDRSGRSNNTQMIAFATVKPKP